MVLGTIKLANNLIRDEDLVPNIAHPPGTPPLQVPSHPPELEIKPAQRISVHRNCRSPRRGDGLLEPIELDPKALESEPPLAAVDIRSGAWSESDDDNAERLAVGCNASQSSEENHLSKRSSVGGSQPLLHVYRRPKRLASRSSRSLTKRRNMAMRRRLMLALFLSRMSKIMLKSPATAHGLKIQLRLWFSSTEVCACIRNANKISTS
jgi:hypothetical protein